MTARWIDLKCHPSTPTATVRSIAVLLRREASELRLTYRLEGDISRTLMPSPAAPRIGVELWRHTCFEAFISVEAQKEYHEFNFAPSAEWTVYAFSGYRSGGPLADESMRPDIALRSTDGRLELDAIARLDPLSDLHPRARLRIGLAAVIEASDGFSYWALHHPAEKPDFHAADGFALLLEPPGSNG